MFVGAAYNFADLVKAVRIMIHEWITQSPASFVEAGLVSTRFIHVLFVCCCYEHSSIKEQHFFRCTAHHGAGVPSNKKASQIKKEFQPCKPAEDMVFTMFSVQAHVPQCPPLTITPLSLPPQNWKQEATLNGAEPITLLFMQFRE